MGSKNIPLNLHYPLPPLVHWEWGEQAESEGRDPWSKRSGGHPKKWPHRWLGPQNIPFDVHYPLPPLGPLGMRGASWEWGEQALAQQRLSAPQNLGSPKHTPWSPLPLPPSIPLAPLAPWAYLGLWDLPGASGSLVSLGKPLAGLGLQSDLGALLPLPPTLLLPLAPPHSPCPWASLDPWDLPGASGSLGSLWKPLAALGLQSDSGALLPLLPLIPSPFAPSCSPQSLSLSGPLGPSWGLRKPWKPWASLRSLGNLGSFLSLREQEGARRSKGGVRGSKEEWGSEPPGETFTTWYLEKCTQASSLITSHSLRWNNTTLTKTESYHDTIKWLLL